MATAARAAARHCGPSAAADNQSLHRRVGRQSKGATACSQKAAGRCADSVTAGRASTQAETLRSDLGPRTWIPQSSIFRRVYKREVQERGTFGVGLDCSAEKFADDRRRLCAATVCRLVNLIDRKRQSVKVLGKNQWNSEDLILDSGHATALGMKLSKNR